MAIDASATESFLLTMKDACLDNEITCDMAAVDRIHTIPEDASTTTPTTVASSACVQKVYNPLTENDEDSSGYCTFTSTLEIWDEGTDAWATYTTADTATWPWIKTSDFSTSNSARVVSVDTALKDTYVRPVTYNLRWKATDPESTKEKGTVYDYFDIKIQYGCTLDTVELINSGKGRATEFTYTIGDTSGTTNNFAKTTTHGHAVTDCPITMECQYYDLDS